jgi:hypothetical protein
MPMNLDYARGKTTRTRIALAVFFQVLIAGGVGGLQAHAQNNRIALKSRESVELGPTYWVARCRSIMIGLPEVEVLEGPEEITLSVKEAMVLPRRQNCADRVPGGIVVITAKEIAEPKEGQLTYRLKFKTKDGDRQASHAYRVSLFP